MNLFKDRSKKVEILLPISDGMKGRTVQSLCDLVTNTKQAQVSCLVSHGSRLVDKCRNALVEHALSRDFSHVLFIDSDMVFPSDSLDRMISHDRDVVGCAYVSRGNMPVPYLFGEFEADGQVKLRVRELLNPQTNGHSLVKVGAIAAGILLVKTKVFKEIPKPFFKFEDDLVGEDLYFSRKVKEAGFDIYCDLKLSEQLEHLGEDGRTLGMFRFWIGTPAGQRFLEQNKEIVS